MSEGMSEKTGICRWYNDAQAAVALMIDDLSFGFLNHYGSGYDARSDWGYGCRGEASIFGYFEKHFLAKFPEVRYTVFLPFDEHAIARPATGYARASGDAFVNPAFRDLLKYIVAAGNEIAYHGHNHGNIDATLDPVTWSGEYSRYGEGGYAGVIRGDLARMREECGIEVTGGKFPGYRYDAALEKAMGTLGLSWWVFDFDPKKGRHGYRQGLVDLPANLSGNVFNRSGRPFRDLIRDLVRESRLAAMVRSGSLISVQEHFLSTRPDGRRQTPNIFDDIFSLERLFGFLRGFDLWYATSSQLAGYARSNDRAILDTASEGGFDLSIPDGGPEAGVSVRCPAPKIRRKGGGSPWIEGSFKKGAFVYNGIREGEYEFD